MYKLSDLEIEECFFPFTATTKRNGWEGMRYAYSIFNYNAYDLSELVFYIMIIPIAYWGYIYYRDKKKKNK
jgi:hypothetical protein